MCMAQAVDVLNLTQVGVLDIMCVTRMHCDIHGRSRIVYITHTCRLCNQKGEKTVFMYLQKWLLADITARHSASTYHHNLPLFQNGAKVEI